MSNLIRELTETHQGIKALLVEGDVEKLDNKLRTYANNETDVQMLKIVLLALKGAKLNISTDKIRSTVRHFFLIKMHTLNV